MLVNFHDRSLITTSVAVIGRTEDGDHIPILTPIVALHDQLMCSCDQGQAVVVVERLRDVLSKRIASTSWTYAPSAPIVWVTPQQVAHWALMRHLLNAVEASNVVKGVDAGRKTSVEAEDLVVDESGEREIVEQVREELPDVGIAVLPQAFIVETIDLCDLS